MATKRKEKPVTVQPVQPQREPLQDFLLRLPLSVHTQLKVKAAQEHTTVRALINQAINTVLKGGEN
jgi:predicted HicB family RNase H-like nuclease